MGHAHKPDGEEDEKECQGLIIKERKGGESSRTNGLISHRSTHSNANQSRVSITANDKQFPKG
jgi:hypothetical protein